MAEAVFVTSKRTLECSICLQMYNLKDRIPKNLKCGHTFCESCVNNLNHNSVIKCPKDRTDSPADDLVTSFVVTDILDTLCEVCNSQQKAVKCYHCETTICMKCLEKHAPSYHNDLRSELDELQEHITSASDVSNNATFLELEEKKAQGTTEQIRQAIKTKRAALDQIEKDLKGEVKRIKIHNTEQCVKWQKGLEEQITEAEQFHQQSDQTLGITYTPQCTMEVMHDIHDECDAVSNGIMDSKNKQPLSTDYSFVETTNLGLTKPGEIVLSGSPDAVALYKIPQASGQSADIYRTARFKCMTGSQGSGPEEFSITMYVASMDDRLLVTDQHNHRIKIYDHNLHLLHLYGTEGGKPYQFNHPVGVTVNAENDILVSDYSNGRITILTKYCKRKYSFGKGRDNTNMCDIDGPTGICMDNIGNIYVCEQNKHRVKALTEDGAFLHDIGDSDTMSGKLKGKSLDVAVHNGKLLISNNQNKSLSVFTTSGQYVHAIPAKLPDTFHDNTQPIGIAVDKYNNIIYADFAGYLVVLNQEGDFVCTIGSPGDKPGEFKQPWDVNITPQGDIVVCDRGNHRVQIFEV